ncbi:MAG: YciI family protein [Caulobacter sp.]
MLYALLCYNDEAEVFAWDQDQDAAVMARLEAVQQTLDKAGKPGPSLRLLPTAAATTLRKDQDLIIDGPYAETKEQLLGFYLLDIEGLEEGLAIALANTSAEATHIRRHLDHLHPRSATD